jgi:hypothetical protein
VVSALLELAGFVLVVAFFAIWWWPSALLVAGVGLLAASMAPRVPRGGDRR